MGSAQRKHLNTKLEEVSQRCLWEAKEGGNGRTAALRGNTALKLVPSVHGPHGLHILTLVVAL